MDEARQSAEQDCEVIHDSNRGEATRSFLVFFFTSEQNGDVDGVRRLVGAHAALLGLTYKVKDGSQKVNTSPLGAAVSKGKCAVAEVLLDAGQYPDDSSGDKTMPWSLLFRKNAALDEQVRIALAELMRRKSPNDRALLNMVCDARDSR